MSALPENFYIPPSARDEPKPLKCRMCGFRAARDTEFIAHLETCYARIEPAVREVVAEHRAEYDNIPDPEWRDYNEGLRADGMDPYVQYNRGRRSNIRRAGES